MKKELESQYVEFQNLQRQLQLVMMQKQQFQLETEEIRIAGAELEKSEGAVYRGVGSLLLQTTKEAAAKDLAERKETVETRVKLLEKQEEKFKARLNELKKTIEAGLKPGAEEES